MPMIVFATNPYVEPLLDGVIEFSRKRDWKLVTSMRRKGAFPDYVKPDGVLATVVDDHLRDRLAGMRVPVVRMLEGLGGNGKPWPAVVPDYRACGRAGAEHLLQMGRPNVAFFLRHDLPGSRAICAGFREVMAKAGRAVNMIDFPADFPGRTDHHVKGGLSLETMMSHVDKKLKALPKPCAIMAEDDRYGVQIIRQALRLGFRVPEDLSVLGCDNQLPDVRMAPVSLSSVDPNLQGVGYRAAELMESLLAGIAPPQVPLVVPVRGVVARDSTAMFMCDDARVSSVVCRIRGGFREDLQLEDLARDAGMSMRSLQAEFKRVLGHTMRDELQLHRMACAERLLRDTDLKLAAIAAESGMTDVKSLARFFQLKHALTASEFRQKSRERRQRQVLD